MEHIPLILVVLLISTLVCLFRSTEKAFVTVYLPTLLLLPQSYQMWNEGLPDLTFSNAAIIPIGIAFFAFRWRDYRFSWTDLLVVALLIVSLFSEYYNGFTTSTNGVSFDNRFDYTLTRLWQNFLNFVLPYFVAKSLIETRDLRVAAAKVIVICISVNTVLMMMEMVFDQNIAHRILDSFFPGQWRQGVMEYRWGFVRPRGVFGHPIFAGLGGLIGFRLLRWLEWNGHYQIKSHGSSTQSVTVSLMKWLCIAHIILPFSRGPWLGALASSYVVAIGHKRNRWLSLTVRTLAGIFLAMALWYGTQRFIEIGDPEATWTFRYRWNLIPNNQDFILQKPYFGWGTFNVPTNASFDNGFLFLAMIWGMTGLILLATAIALTSLRLLLRGMSRTTSAAGGDLSFTLFATLIGFAVTIVTVYMDDQLIQLLFLLIGWGEGYLCYAQRSTELALQPSRAQST